VNAALNYTPESEAPKKPSYKQIDRVPGDSTSYLGFTCGTTEQKNIVIMDRWHCLAIHNASAQVIGRIQVSAELSKFNDSYFEVRIFSPEGNQLFRLETSEPSTRFDAVKLPAGDLLVCYRSKSDCKALGQ
jgi:hypothetical protein